MKTTFHERIRSSLAPRPPAGIIAAVPPEAVREELNAILASECFAQSKRLQRFLVFVVEQALEGRAASLNEYSLAGEVFDRRNAFDPRKDTIVRVEARRLRQQLTLYYQGPGNRDAIRIDVPKGGYAPRFVKITLDPVRPAKALDGRWRKWIAAGGAALALLVLAAGAMQLARFSARATPAGRSPRPARADVETHLWEGRYLYSQRTPEGVEKSVEAFEKAIADDPESADAYAGLAESCAALGFHRLAPHALTIGRARDAALKAIALSPGHAGAHGVLGWICFAYDRDWPKAERELRKSIQADSRAAATHEWYAYALSCQRRFDEAVSESRLASNIDPWLAAEPGLAVVLYNAGRLAEAMEESRRLIRLNPAKPVGHITMGASLAALGQYRAAVDSLKRGLGPSDRHSSVVGRLGFCYARLGLTADATALLARLTNESAHGTPNYVEQAMIYTGLDDRQHALRSLRLALEQREADVVVLSVERVFASLWPEPEYRALCKLAGVPQP